MKCEAQGCSRDVELVLYHRNLFGTYARVCRKHAPILYEGGWHLHEVVNQYPRWIESMTLGLLMVIVAASLWVLLVGGCS